MSGPAETHIGVVSYTPTAPAASSPAHRSRSAMQSLLRDVRFGVRTLLKSPGLAFVAILALTLGIGLTTTMFSIVYGALLKGLPYRDGARMFVVYQANPARGITRQSIPIQDYFDYHAQQR